MKTIKGVACTIVVGLMVITQLIHPTRAHAGGGSPLHPTETIVPTKAPTKPPVTETPVPTEIPAKPTTVAPEVTEEPIQEPTTTKPANSLEILQNLPVKIRVVALNENGQVLPLAGEEAAAVIAEGDPVWCPAGQAPTPGANGCTISYATLGDLVAAEGVNINADGTIWITTGTIADASTVTIDGLTYTNWADNALTLQGGWDGIAGSTTISSNSVFSTPITITNWSNGIIIQNVDAPSIALSNVTVSNGNNVSVGSDSSIDAANSNSNVTLSNISVTGATRTDIYGYYIPGIYVNTLGDITANDITANGNGGLGAYLYSSSGNITLIGNNTFNDNAYTGLVAVSNGDVALNQVTANGNGGGGASLSSSSGNITLTGTNAFNDNGYDGLDAYSYGDIALNQVTASENGGLGAYLYSSSGNINLTGTNAFNNNGYDGLDAYSYGGDITLHQITASENGGWGAYLYSSSGNITLEGKNEFNDNAYEGLSASSSGHITLNNVTATGNAFFNSWNPSDVSLFTPGNATMNYSTVGILDASAVCGNLALNKTKPERTYDPVAGEHIFYDEFGYPFTIYCNPKIYVDGQLLGELPTVLSTLYAFDLSCDSQTLYPRELPNGDKVTIVCPVSGRAFISRLDNTTIPPGLPTGYTYASAFSVNIVKAGESIPVITEGGHIEVSFQVPSQQDSIYSILYWDDQNNTWIPLNDFIGPESNPQTFALNPGVTEDLRKIESGVKLVTKTGFPRVEVSTNFPGIFVLAQH
jgi:hypothetical protein